MALIMTNVHVAFPHVGDLRQLHRTPDQLRIALAGHFPGPLASSPDDTTPVDTAIIVLRQLYAHILRSPARFPSTEPENATHPDEASCALLRFIWADFSRTNSQTAIAAQVFLKGAIVQQLQPLHDNVAGLLSAALLRSTLWNRREFHLHDATCIIRPPNSPLWRHAPCDLPLHQLLNYDGVGDLAPLLSWRWVRPVEHPGNKFHVQHLFGRPVVMAICYTAAAARSFDELKRLVFVAKYLRRAGGNMQQQQPQQQLGIQQGPLDYRLIAAVRCAGEEGKDSVKLYSQAGEMVWSDGGEWEIGKRPGVQYLLYYGLAIAEPRLVAGAAAQGKADAAAAGGEVGKEKETEKPEEVKNPEDRKKVEEGRKLEEAEKPDEPEKEREANADDQEVESEAEDGRMTRSRAAKRRRTTREG